MTNSRRLDIGIAAYGKPERLEQVVNALATTMATDWRCLIVINQHPDKVKQQAIETLCARVQYKHKHRVHIEHMPRNVGYAGAVNVILTWAETEYVAYCDDDAIPLTWGWDETLASLLDRYHELGMVFPNGGAAPIGRGPYVEILWGVGFCWVVNRAAMRATLPVQGIAETVIRPWPFGRDQYFDETLGHQDEVDFQTRLRLAGYKIGADPGVQVVHHATATNDPASLERISAGVVNWVNKWTRYFAGPRVTYHSENVIRHEDWPPSALHMEQYFKQFVPNLNATPEVIVINGTEYDLIRVPRLKGFYRHRIV